MGKGKTCSRRRRKNEAVESNRPREVGFSEETHKEGKGLGGGCWNKKKEDEMRGDSGGGTQEHLWNKQAERIGIKPS